MRASALRCGGTRGGAPAITACVLHATACGDASLWNRSGGVVRRGTGDVMAVGVCNLFENQTGNHEATYLV